MRKKLTMLLASLFLVLGTAWAQISTLGDLDNSKAYLLKNANDMGYAIWKSGDNLTLCGASSKYTDALDETAGGSNWQIIKYDEKYFLYNVGAEKFAVTKSGATELVDIPTPISVEEVSAGSKTFAFNSTGGNKDYMCAAHHLNPPVQFWVKDDAGSAWQIIENTKATSLQDLLVGAAKVEEYFSTQVKLTIQYKLTGTNDILYTTEVMATKDEQYTVEAPYFTSVASVTISGTIGEQTFTVPNTATTITVELKDEFPYKKTTLVNGEFPADAAWYVIKQNSTNKDTKTWKYDNGVYVERNEDPSTYAEKHLWCFAGNVFDLKIYSKVAGATKVLSATNPVSMAESNSVAWKVVGSAAVNNFNGLNPFCLQKGSETSYINISGTQLKYYGQRDGGSTIRAIESYPLTVVYQFEGAELTDLRVEKVVEPGTVYTIENSDAFDGKIIKSVEGATDNGDGTWAVTVNAATTVTVTLGYEDTNLYALKSPAGTYFSFVAPTDGTSSAASFQDTPTFFYKEVSGTGYTFEDMGTSGRFIGLNGGWNVGTTSAVWNISAEDADGYVTISRNSGSGNLGHDTKWIAGTGVFTNVGANCNKWQLNPAYPVTIIYMQNSSEIDRVKAGVFVGGAYTIDTKGQTVVSCETDKGEVVVTDGVYTIPAVNGATTVTVTLKGVEEPEVPVVFNPTPGKAYALKVKGQELYLNIRTLGIDDPSTSGSNNISLSARPFAAIYFEAGSTEGTWKMKNVNGKYVGVPGKGWNPMICDTPHDWTIVLEDGVVTIAKSAGAFVNANDGAVAAGNPLYCDKGTALQFELLDYENVDFITGAGLGKEGAEGPYVAIKEIDADGTTTLPVGMGWILTVEVENPNGASHGQWGSSILATGKEPFPYKDKHNGFQLYLQSATNGSKKLDVVFGNADHIVNNVSYTGDFKAVITYDGTGNLKVVTTNAEGNEETNNYKISLPAISEFAYGLPTGINIKRLSIETIEREYTFALGTTPEGQNVAVTYGDEAIEAGATIKESELDLGLFAATEIEGYTWAVVADKAANTLTLNYTQAEVADLQAVKNLVNRIGGEGTADKFMFVHTPWLNSKQETFILGAQDGKIRIEGSTISAITTGIGWYLNNVAHINIAWNSLNEKTVSGAAYADLSNLPLPSQTETHTSDAKYRYYLNTCTFGYSMTSWTWKRWQQEIDWMALHGINMPLQLVGLEEVWRTFLTMEDANGNRKYGYTDEEAKAFVAGPAFIAWWAMNNLEGWGGTAAGSKSGYNNLAGAGGVQDDAWYARQKKLAKQIVDAQRGLGMQPVLPGWSGMVPTNFQSKSGFATRGNGGKWAGDFVRPLLLNVNIGADKYAEIAADYYACLHAVMGESQYYSMDPFHEGGGAGTMEDYEALYAAMEVAKPGSQWVIQQWQWSPTQKYSLTAVPEGRLIVLDLFSDGSPAFDGYNGYAPQEAVFCAIPNFGGRSGLMGRLQNVTDNYFKFKGKYTSIKGIGTAPEAIEQTPVTYDLIYQLPWMNGEKPNVAEWVDNYAVSRYGKDNAVVKEAWSLLRQGPLNYGADGIQGPVEDVWAARPNLDANKASSWGVTLANAGGTYTLARRQMLIDAVYKLIDQKDELALEDGSVYKSNYMYDLVEFGGAVMADYAYDLLLGIKAAKNAEGTNGATYIARRDAFLQLILDMDAFRGTNLNFRLGKWTQEARDAAGEVEGATTATPDWYEYNNARTIVSTWSSPGTNLNDYSYRSWQGLLKDYYYKRWKYFFDNNCTNGEYKFFEWNWAHGKEHYVGQTGISNVDLTADQDGHTSKYTREPVGNTVEKAVEMLGKYIIPIKYNDGTTYYAYRTFTTDLAGKATVRVAAGGNVDFTKLFNIPDDAKVSGTVVKGDSPAQANAVPVQDAVGNYIATITLADGTVLSNITVVLVAMDDFEGVYTIALHQDNTSYDTYIANNGGRYELTAGQNVSPAVADKMFTIVPSSVGYTFSAQGQYLKTPKANSLTFSSSEKDMGAYIIEKLDGDNKYKLRTSNKYLKADEDFLFASSNDASTFTITKAETYPFSVSAAGMATLCLPFNVVMADGMYAYDLSRANIEAEEDEYVCTMKAVAAPGETLKKDTPVIIQAEEGAYNLAITMDDTDAKGALEGSLLKGNFVSQALTQSKTTPKFIFANGEAGVGFYLLADGTSTIGANKCWLEWDMTLGQVANSISLRFGDDTTDVEHIETSRPTQLVIYNILGQRLDAPQKGINIINGKKVLIK